MGEHHDSRVWVVAKEGSDDPKNLVGLSHPDLVAEDYPGDGFAAIEST
jgi:hypothetical protein